MFILHTLIPRGFLFNLLLNFNFKLNCDIGNVFFVAQFV